MAILLAGICLLATLSSCWDEEDIEDIGFVMAVGFDPLPEEENGQNQEDDGGAEESQGEQSGIHEEHNHKQKFVNTYQVAVPQAMAMEEGGGDLLAYFNISTVNTANYKPVRQATSRMSRKPNATHMRLLLVNQELAREGMLEHLLDLYVRNPRVRRNMKVFITRGRAQDILDTQVPLEDSPADYIEMISDNYPLALSMKSPVTAGELAAKIIGHRSFLVPRVVGGKEDIRISGAAVFRGLDNQMLGWLGDNEVGSYNWMQGEAENAVMEVNYQDALFAFETTASASSIEYERKNGQDHFTVQIKAEGTFAESWGHDIAVDDPATLEELEEAVATQIEEQTEQLMDKMQHEFQCDIFEFVLRVRAQEYDYWRDIQREWDGEGGRFSEAQVHIHADARILHYDTQEHLQREEKTS